MARIWGKENNAFKPFATLTRTPSTPRLFARDFARFAQTALRAGRRFNLALCFIGNTSDNCPRKVDKNLLYFSGDKNETKEFINRVENELDLMLPDDLKWLLVTRDMETAKSFQI